MKTRISILLAAVLLAALLAVPALADSPYNISGNGAVPVSFTVTTWTTNATITMTQERGTFVYSNGYYSALSWGCYHVDCSVNGVSSRAEWNSSTGRETFTLSLKRQGTYTITVTPYTDEEMRQQISYFGSWRTGPSWALTSAYSCQPSGGGSVQPSGGKNVTVEYRDAYGNLLQSLSHYCTQGSNTVTAPDTLQNGAYRRISTQSQNVTLYANGNLSTNTLIFYYVGQSVNPVTPTPASSTATVWIYYYDNYGNLLQTTSKLCRQGTNTITAPATLQNNTYTRTSAASQTVTLYSNGTLSPASVSFYYSRRVTPTPVPVTATVWVYYYDNQNNMLQSKSVTVKQGNNTITAPSSLSGGYYLTSSASQRVTLDRNGNLSTATVYFYYAKQSVTGTVTIHNYDVDAMRIISTRTQTLNQGTQRVYAGSAPSGYHLYSESYIDVTVNADGSVNPGVIYFEYQRNSPTAPPVTRAPAPTDAPPSDVGPEVYPTGWDTQMKDGSANPRAISTLPRLYDNDPGSSFYYIYWTGEGKDEIPEITCYFDGSATVSYLGIIPGLCSSSSDFANHGRPDLLNVVIHCDQGVISREVRLKDVYQQSTRYCYLGNTYTGVSRVEIFVIGYRAGDADHRNEIHISGMKFFQ